MKLMNPSRKLFKEKSPTKKGKKEKKLKKKEKNTRMPFSMELVEVILVL
jgi:hypothetical protein